MKKNSGFTLVEILIVVVILGILAAIVIPQFSDASTQSKVSSMKSSLQTMRSQVSLYRIQHNDIAPTSVAQLTGKTDQDGTANTSGAFGPYLQSVPSNPFQTESASCDPDGISFGTATASPGDDTTGWYMNDQGDVWANDSQSTDSVAHKTY